MTAMNEFDSLVQSLNPVLYAPFIKGNLAKRDSYGGSVTVASGSPAIVRGEKGYQCLINGGRLLVADSGARPELQIDPGTIMVFSSCFRFATAAENNYRTLSKLDAGGTHFDCSVTSGAVSFVDAGGSRFVSVDPGESKVIAITFESGNKAEFFYADNKYVSRSVGLSASNVAITPNDADLSIGAYYSNIRQCPIPLHCLLMFPTVLADRNISDVCSLFGQIQIKTSEPELTPARIHQVKDQLLRIDGRTVDGLVPDLSGNCLGLTPTPAMEWEEVTPSGGRGMAASGGVRGPSNLSVTDATLDDLFPSTYAFWVRRDGPCENNEGRIYEKGSGKLRLYVNNNGRLYLYDSWSVSNGVYRTNDGAIPTGVPVFVVVRYDGFEGVAPVFTINGVDVSIVVTSATSGVRTSDAGESAYLLDRSADDREFEGMVDDFQIIPRYVSDDEAKALYLCSALRVLDRGYEFVYPETPVALTAGNVGPYSIVSGTVEWTADNELTGSAGCEVSMRSAYDYHAMYFEFLKKSGNSIVVWYSIDRLDLNGYQILINSNERVRLRRRLAGGFTTVDETADSYIANDVRYQCFIARTPADLFRLWLRGGAFTTWTLVLSGTNSDVNGSELVNSSYGLDDILAKFALFEYGSGLTPNDVPWLAD